MLYLSYVNLLKHLEGLGILEQIEMQQNHGKKTTSPNKVIMLYENAIFSSDMIKQDKKEVAASYMEYLKESCTSIGQIKSAYNRLRDNEILETPLEQPLH